MNLTYRATLHGDRIEWEEDVPEQIRTQESLSVVVTILSQPVAAGSPEGPRMAAVLERLALSGGVSSITDPVEWQREQREDRTIPDRT